MGYASYLLYDDQVEFQSMEYRDMVKPANPGGHKTKEQEQV